MIAPKRNKSKQAELAPGRQEQLREMIRLEGVARLNRLCEMLHASPATIRRDLGILEAQGKIRRVHGGAVSVESRLEEPLFDDKASISAHEKSGIAAAAASLVRTGDTIFLDGGSTVLQLARLLADRTDVTVVTNSLRAAIELSGRGPRLILTGGELRRLSQTVVGPLSHEVLDTLSVDKAFMGTVGLTAANGLTTTDPNEAFTKREVVARAKEVILLADHTKIGMVSFSRFGRIDDIDVLITDKKADGSFLSELRKKRVKIVVA